eukprot:4614767-Pleurochrysis_carterae.AAC.1
MAHSLCESHGNRTADMRQTRLALSGRVHARAGGEEKLRAYARGCACISETCACRFSHLLHLSPFRSQGVREHAQLLAACVRRAGAQAGEEGGGNQVRAGACAVDVPAAVQGPRGGRRGQRQVDLGQQAHQ